MVDCGIDHYGPALYIDNIQKLSRKSLDWNVIFMKLILQNLQTGLTEIVEVPSPGVKPAHLLIHSTVSLVSAGTERMLVDFGKAGLIDKARRQPEKVKMVLEKIGTDGLLTTIDAVRAKLAQPIPLGYANVGVIGEVGQGVEGFAVGDRVVSNAHHADLVCVPRNLCARIPDAVTDESAAFVVLAAIALQGIRLARPTLGECVAVTGVGLIGLLAVQLLRAQGCRVLAIDIDDTRLALARGFGAETCNPATGLDPVAAGMAFSRDQGVDAVIITASTQDSEPISQAARMSRKRGRIVLVGVTGLELKRADFYEKELSFQVSCSYGPGRYDPAYEEQGQDYPIGYVRWTEQRNFQAVLDLMAAGQLDVQPLISRRFGFEQAPAAYEVLSTDKGALGILLQYPALAPQAKVLRRVALPARGQTETARAAVPDGSPVLGVIGAGNYAGRVLIPAFARAGAHLHTLVSAGGVSSVINGRKAGFRMAATEIAVVLEDPAINTVVIATRHDSHASLVLQALRAGKHVFVEKPLCLTVEELAAIETQWRQAGKQAEQQGATRPLLTVGYNRRFAPQVLKMRELLAAVVGPRAFVMTVNAGAIPAGHWTQDPAVGGGRIIGEACHFVDLLRFLAGVPIIAQHGSFMTAASRDTATLTLTFADDSIGTVHYLANGGKAFPKERLEVFADGAVLQLDNFRKLRGYGWRGFSSMNIWRQDKGHDGLVNAFLKAVAEGGPPPIPPEEIFEGMNTLFTVGASK